MRISIDQAITASGLVAFTKKGVVATTITPDQGFHDLAKQKNVAEKIISWLDDLQRAYPRDPITHICLEEFIEYVPDDRKRSMMRLQRFSGYLWARLEAWGSANNLDLCISQIGKGSVKKSEAQMLAKSFGFAGTEHECDAFHQGCLAGWVR